MLREFEARLQRGESPGSVDVLPVKAATRKTIRQEAGDLVRVQLHERIG